MSAVVAASGLAEAAAVLRGSAGAGGLAALRGPWALQVPGEVGEESLQAWTAFGLTFAGLALFDACALAPRRQTDGTLAAGGRLHLHCVFWLCIGVVFNAAVWACMGRDLGVAWFNGYVLEYMLSLDNVFMFLPVFRAYGTPQDARYKALFLGILIAIVLRLLFFWGGAELFQASSLVQLLFGLVIIYSGFNAVTSDDGDGDDPSEMRCLRLLTRCLPFTDTYDPPGRLFVRVARCRYRGTKLLLVVIALGFVDVLFAADSVMAKLAAHGGMFINFSSSALAMLCLRSLYFVLETFLKEFRFLKYGVSAILIFIGVKLVISRWYTIAEGVSLLVICAVFALSVALSVILPEEPGEDADAEVGCGHSVHDSPRAQGEAQVAQDGPPAEGEERSSSASPSRDCAPPHERSSA